MIDLRPFCANKYEVRTGLHRIVVAGRDTCTGACETRVGCDCISGFPRTVPTEPAPMVSAYGDLRPITPPRVVPCSTVARWWLELRRLLG